MYSTFLILTLLAPAGQALVFRLPTLNDSVWPGESNLIAWSDFGDVTEVNVYLAHGTPSNYTILQTVGEKVPSSTNSMMYHLPSTLPPTNVFFMLEGNDSPKSVATRSVFVDTHRFDMPSFPSLSIPSGLLPSGFPYGSIPTSDPTPAPQDDTHDHGLPMPAIVGIAVGSFAAFAIVLVTLVVMKNRQIRQRRKMRRALLQPKPPPKWTEKPTDINVNVAIHPEGEHTEYNYNYNYQPEYQQEYNYQSQMDQSYTHQHSSPGGFIVPSPKTADQTAPHDNYLHETTPTIPSPAHLTSTKTSLAPYENKPNVPEYHKPNASPRSDKPHSVPTTQKPHS